MIYFFDLKNGPSRSPPHNNFFHEFFFKKKNNNNAKNNEFLSLFHHQQQLHQPKSFKKQNLILTCQIKNLKIDFTFNRTASLTSIIGPITLKNTKIYINLQIQIICYFCYILLYHRLLDRLVSMLSSSLPNNQRQR